MSSIAGNYDAGTLFWLVFASFHSRFLILRTFNHFRLWLMSAGTLVTHIQAVLLPMHLETLTQRACKLCSSSPPNAPPFSNRKTYALIMTILQLHFLTVIDHIQLVICWLVNMVYLSH